MRLTRSVRWLLEGLLLLVMLAGGGGGYLVWRLSQGPLSLDPVLPYVEQALSDPSDDLSVRIRSAELVWDSEARALGVNIRGLRAFDGETPIVAAPRLTLFADAMRLFEGKFAPTEVLIDGLSLQISRGADGNVSMGFFSGGASLSADGAASPAPLLPGRGDSPEATYGESPRDFILRTIGPKRGEGPTSALTVIRLRHASLLYHDVGEGMTVRVPEFDVSLRRTPEGPIVGSIAAKVEVAPNSLSPVETGLTLDFRDPDREDDDILTVTAALGPVKPAQLARLAPETLGILSGFDAPASISARLEMEGLDRFTGGDVTFQMTRGILHHALLPSGSLPVEGGVIRAHYQGDTRQVRLDEARLSFGDGMVLELGGQVTAAAPYGGRVTARLLSVAVDSLASYWPQPVSTNAREWILANLSKGRVKQAEATVEATWAGPGSEPEISSLTAGLDVEGLQVQYFGKLPPVTGVNGRLVYDNAHGRLTVQTNGGQIAGTKVVPGNGTITIDGLKGADQSIRIELPLKGPVPDILSVIDSQPLGYARKLGAVPARTAGEAEGRLVMSFPLLAALKVEQIALSVDATVRGGALPGIGGSYDLTDADLKLKLDTKALEASGSGRVNGVALSSLSVVEPFSPRAYRTVKVAGTLDAAARAALRVPGQDWVDGAVPATLTYQEAAGRQARLTGTLDLGAARVHLDEYAVEKPAGHAATGSYDVLLVGGDVREVSRFEMTGPGLAVSLSARFADGGIVQSIDLPQVKIGQNDLSATLIRQKGGWNISARGRKIDLIDWLAREKKVEEGLRREGKPLPPPASVTLSGSFGAVRMVDGPELGNVSVRVVREGHVWHELDASGTAGGRQFRAKITPTAQGRLVSARADDLGALLLATDLTDQVIGGQAVFEGSFRPGVSGVSGQAKVSTYRLRGVPLLGRLLAVASITGIPEMMGGEGLAFDSTEVDLRMDETTIDIREAFSSGLSIGITAKGLVNRNGNTLDLVGEVVPLAGINRVVGSIPILGDLLTGGKGGGIFAWTWSAKGTPSDPQVSVNPVSVLAPGIFRRIFQGTPGSETPAAPPPPQDGGDR